MAGWRIGVGKDNAATLSALGKSINIDFPLLIEWMFAQLYAIEIGVNRIKL